MATITSVGTGNWATAGTWDSGVPADGDDVVIASGHVVTFDADQSAFTTGVKITITGTLNHALTGGPYTMFLKTGASVTGAGTWNVGTSANPVPFAVKHTITGADGWYISGASGLTMTVYGAEPTTKYVRLSNAEGVGDTVLEVDTDVTGDIWAVGDTIHINNVNKNAQSEERVIAAAGIAAGSITITAGLTAAKLAGSYVCLMTRNIKIVGVGTAYTCNGIASGKLTVGGGQWTTTNYRSFGGCHNMTIAGGTFYGNIPLYSNNAVTVSGGVFSGNTYAVQLGTAMYVTGGVFSGNSGGIYAITGAEISGGVFVGNTNAIIACPGSYVSGGTFYGNTNGLYSLVGFTASGGTITGNTSGLNSVSGDISSLSLSDNTQDINTSIVTAYNCLFGSATENTGYTSVAKQAHSESIDHDQVAGAYKVWTKGGVTTKQAVTYPTGFTNSMQTVLESATSEGYWQKEILVGAGQSVNITSYLRKDASMSYLPRVIIFNKAEADPFAGGAGIHTFTMTDAIDTFEDDLYTYTNTGTKDVTLVIRTQGMNATGNVFSYLDIEIINVDLTSVLALLGVVDGIVDAIKVQTDKIPASPASAGEYTANIGAIKAKTDNLPLSPASSGEYTSALTAIQNDLDNPNQYKADVSNLALQATSLAIKGQTDKIPAAPAQTGEYNAALTAIQADLDNPTQYKADVSGLATTTHVQEVENKIDAIDITVNTIPTNPLLDTAYIAPDNAGIAAIQEKTEQLTFTAPNKVDASATVDPTGIATSEEMGIIGEKVDGVLNKLNVSSVEFVTAVVGSNITMLRGDTLAARLLDLGDLTQYASLDFTVKRVAGELDDAAKIRLRKNASGTDDGLLRINGAEYATATDGSIVIDDLTTGDIEIKLNAAATQELVPGNYVYDVQLIIANEVRTLTAGKLEVVADVTRAVA